MRKIGLSLMACLVSGSAYAQDAGAISSPALSRCAGKFGAETRAADPAFVSLALDGVPWLTTEQTDDTVGSQPISETVTGTGYRRRRDGTEVHMRPRFQWAGADVPYQPSHAQAGRRPAASDAPHAQNHG